MRRWFILLMVVMLPLRGWAGDLMSVQMATMATMNATVDTAAAMPADCPMHTGSHVSDASEQGPAPQSDGMQSCSSCDLCIPLAELASGRLEVMSFAVHQQPLMPQVAFISASLAPAVEPPIS